MSEAPSYPAAPVRPPSRFASFAARAAATSTLTAAITTTLEPGISVRNGRPNAYADLIKLAGAVEIVAPPELRERLAAAGISVEVIDPRTVSPLDGETILRSVHKTGRLLIVDEAFAPFGLGAEVAAHVVDAGFDDLDAPVRRLHGAFTPTPYSPPLEKAVVPQVEDIERAVRGLLEE
jgi:2-oxoisovalerate dehydrogenase E1 component